MSLRYDKIRVIGQGAFGKVFLCKKVGDSTHVVMKQIPVDDLPPDERKSAMNEVDVLAMLQHPNIIAYYDSFVEDKSLNIVMEYAPGGTLCEYIQERNGRLLEEEHILQLFVQTLVAIEHVHLMNILHRDLKPQNIMLNKKRTVVKIGDFGIAKVLSSKITSAQTVVGTPCYISPEICEGRMYNRKSDIWALGCILYELTALHKAFEGSNLPALVMKIMQGSRALSPLNDKYSQGLTLLINSMLCRNPEDRPNIENIMANPVLVNTLINLGTTVGRLPCSKQNKSHFRDDYSDMSEKAQSLAPIKPVVYMWGGSLSLPLVLPQPIESHVTGIDLGRTHRIALTEDGKLINWELESGSLNTVGLTLASRAKAKDPIIFQPHLVEGLSNIDIKKISCGDLFTACLTDNGILMTYGSGINGCLGHGNYDDISKPKLVGSMLQYETSDMDCGANHMVAITSMI
jgi:NIMA (never in mitosis gene a)-related kinase